MKIPNEKDSRWVELIKGEKWPEFDMLATKMLLGELSRSYNANPTERKMTECIISLQNFFEMNKSIPKAKTDLMKIFQ